MVENQDVRRGFDECGPRFQVEDGKLHHESREQDGRAFESTEGPHCDMHELFAGMVESSEEDESSSSYSDLTPPDIEEIRGAAVKGGNQHAEEVAQVEEITTIRALQVSTSEVVVPNATPVSATVGKVTQDDGHMAEVTPPSLAMTF